VVLAAEVGQETLAAQLIVIMVIQQLRVVLVQLAVMVAMGFFLASQ
jgi:hypothetical protein